MVDFFRRGEAARDARLLAAQGALSTVPLEQLALLVFLTGDAEPDIAETAEATLKALPESAVRAFLAGPGVPAEMLQFFAGRGITPAPADPGANPDSAVAEDDEADEVGENATPTLLAGLPIKTKVKLAFKGTREQRAQLIRDPNKLVASAVLSSPKLTGAEVEAFAKMGNVSEEVLRVIGTHRGWLKSYGVVLGLVKNPKTPAAIARQLLQRVAERDMKMLAVDRNVPEALRLAARKFVVKTRT